MTFARAQVDELLHRLFIDAPATSLRDEDRRKSDEMAGLLVEVEAAAARRSAKGEFVVVDAAAGKAYVGLLAAELILARPASACARDRARAGARGCLSRRHRAPAGAFGGHRGSGGGCRGSGSLAQRARLGGRAARLPGRLLT